MLRHVLAGGKLFLFYGVRSFVSVPNVFVVVVAVSGSHATHVCWLLIVFSNHTRWLWFFSFSCHEVFFSLFPILFPPTTWYNVPEASGIRRSNVTGATFGKDGSTPSMRPLTSFPSLTLFPFFLFFHFFARRHHDCSSRHFLKHGQCGASRGGASTRWEWRWHCCRCLFRFLFFISYFPLSNLLLCHPMMRQLTMFVLLLFFLSRSVRQGGEKARGEKTRGEKVRREKARRGEGEGEEGKGGEGEEKATQQGKRGCFFFFLFFLSFPLPQFFSAALWSNK